MIEIEHMSQSLRVATIAMIVQLDDPKFNVDVWLNRKQFFEGYVKEEVEYKFRKMGYKRPTKKDIAAKAAKIGLNINQVKKMTKPKNVAPVVPVVKKPEQNTNITPVRGSVKRMFE